MGLGKWAAGPTAIVVWQGKLLTAGVLASQLWAFAGPDYAREFARTTLRPVAAVVLRTGWIFSVSSETTYDWEGESKGWQVPLTAGFGKVWRLGNTYLVPGLAGSYYAAHAETGPRGELQVTVTVVPSR